MNNIRPIAIPDGDNDEEKNAPKWTVTSKDNATDDGSSQEELHRPKGDYDRAMYFPGR